MGGRGALYDTIQINSQTADPQSALFYLQSCLTGSVYDYVMTIGTIQMSEWALKLNSVFVVFIK